MQGSVHSDVAAACELSFYIIQDGQSVQNLLKISSDVAILDFAP